MVMVRLLWWWGWLIGALTLTGNRSVLCPACPALLVRNSVVVFSGSALYRVCRVCLLPVLLLPAPQKRSCNSVLCSSNTPPWSAARTQPAVLSATNSSSVAKLWWSTWSTPTRIQMPPALPVSIETTRQTNNVEFIASHFTSLYFSLIFYSLIVS